MVTSIVYCCLHVWNEKKGSVGYQASLKPYYIKYPVTLQSSMILKSAWVSSPFKSPHCLCLFTLLYFSFNNRVSLLLCLHFYLLFLFNWKLLWIWMLQTERKYSVNLRACKLITCPDKKKKLNWTEIGLHISGLCGCFFNFTNLMTSSHREGSKNEGLKHFLKFVSTPFTHSQTGHYKGIDCKLYIIGHVALSGYRQNQYIKHICTQQHRSLSCSQPSRGNV